MKKHHLIGLSVVFIFLLAAVLPADTLTISNAAFNPQGSQIIYRSGYYLWPDSAGTSVQAPVNLPDGAIIDGIRLFYYDNGPALIRAVLVRRSVWQFSWLKLFTVQTSVELNKEQWTCDYSLDSGTRTVNTQNHSYWLDVWFSGSGAKYLLYDVQIIYHMPTT